VAHGAGYRLYQMRKPKNRHLVDVRGVEELPPCNRFEEVLVPTPAELVASKVLSMVSRASTPKGMTDAADLLRLLLKFPGLKTEEGLVSERLRREQDPAKALEAWRELVSREISPEESEEDDAN